MAKVLVSETSGWENVHSTAQDCTGEVKFHKHTTVRQTAQACEGMCAQECVRPPHEQSGLSFFGNDNQFHIKLLRCRLFFFKKFLLLFFNESCSFPMTTQIGNEILILILGC